MLRHGEFNLTTVLAFIIAISFALHLPLIAGLVSWRDRGWRKTAFFMCLLSWLVLVLSVTHALRGLFG